MLHGLETPIFPAVFSPLQAPYHLFSHKLLWLSCSLYKHISGQLVCRGFQDANLQKNSRSDSKIMPVKGAKGTTKTLRAYWRFVGLRANIALEPMLAQAGCPADGHACTTSDGSGVLNDLRHFFASGENLV